MRLAAGGPHATFRLRRELSHRKLPDGKLTAVNHRQSRCYCPREPTAPSVSEGKFGDSEAGIDSRQSFVFDPVLVIHDSKHLARPPWQGGWAMAIFISDNPAAAEVCLISSP